MYGTREKLCVQLENMFTFDESLTLLIWTEEGINTACREALPGPDETEIRAVMIVIGAMKMADYRREGVTNQSVSDLLIRQREAANRLVSVPAHSFPASCGIMSANWSTGPDRHGKPAGQSRNR